MVSSLTSAGLFLFSVVHQDLLPFPTRRSSDLVRTRSVDVWRDGISFAGGGGRARAIRTRGARFGVLHSRRSEEHTSELQSPCNIVCRLLLEKENREQRRAKIFQYSSSRWYQGT